MEEIVNNEIHGHEVMQMMLETGEAYDRDSLEAAIHERFGPTARFCTCSAAGMTASQLIDFLAQKGKFVPTGEGFSTDAGKICNH